MPFSSYRDLRAWQSAMELCRLVYKVTKAFPKEELYGLTLQIRRSAVSVPSNIAEGHAREFTKEFLRHLSVAQGSLAELETQLILACDFECLGQKELEELMQLADDIGKMLRGLQKSLRKKLQQR
jgi:four helix bundle protein